MGTPASSMDTSSKDNQYVYYNKSLKLDEPTNCDKNTSVGADFATVCGNNLNNDFIGEAMETIEAEICAKHKNNKLKNKATIKKDFFKKSWIISYLTLSILLQNLESTP